MQLWPKEVSQRLYALEADPTDDFADRLNYVVTVSVLIFFALLTGTKQHFGSPMQCMVPYHFPGTWVNYAHDYCFVSNTYYQDLSKPLSGDAEDRARERSFQQIAYYQWVPYVLVAQAFIFFIPKIMWNFIISFHELDMRCVVQEAEKLVSLRDPELRKGHIRNLTNFIIEFLGYKHVRHFSLMHYGGCFATIFYTLTKWLFAAVAFVQLVLINHFVGDGQLLWGYYFARALLSGKDWKASGAFPRVTFCDIEIEHLAQSNTYSMQCVLMLNMLNEKIYLALWFWLAVLVFINAIFATRATVFLLSPFYRLIRVRGILQINTSEDGYDERRLSRFVHEALKSDGVLLLTFVDGRAGSIVSGDLARELFLFCETHNSRAPRLFTSSKSGNIKAPFQTKDKFEPVPYRLPMSVRRTISTSSATRLSSSFSISHEGIDAFGPQMRALHRQQH